MNKDSFSYRVLMLFLSNLMLYIIGSCYRALLSRLVPASSRRRISLSFFRSSSETERVFASGCIGDTTAHR